MVKGSINTLKNEKSAGQSGIVSEMVNVTREAGVGMITNLVNQIIVEGVIPGE